MAKEPEDMIMPMLREMRSEMREQFVEMHEQFSAVNARLQKFEAGQKSMCNAMTADTMLSRYATGDFEERISDLEQKVETLMKSK